jgi:hypothetical protein
MLTGCAAPSDESTESESDEALTDSSVFWKKLETKLEAIADAVGGPDSWMSPDPKNRWAQNFTPSRVGEENVLPGEDEDFHKMALDIQSIQEKLKASNAGVYQRAFHAKPHACVKGRFYVNVPDDIVSQAKLPADTDLQSLKVGLLADTAEHDVWVRWSNGVGGANRPDGEADVRGLAMKVMGVRGERLQSNGPFFVQEASTQDFLMTNGATTPAPTSEAFAAFGVSQANMASATGLLGKGKALGGFLGYLVQNPRVGSTLLNKVLTATKNHNSVLAQQFFSGGAIALGVDADGSATQAIKLSAVTGTWKGDAKGHGTCTPATDTKQALDDFAFPGSDPVGTLLGKGDRNYLSTGPRGVKSALTQTGLCINLRVQFQRHDAVMLAAQRQPIEDTSVEWRESDSPWVTVATVLVDRRDDPSAEEDECNSLSWNPWHGLVDHRPLGNIMRVRQEVLAASAQQRGSRPAN